MRPCPFCGFDEGWTQDLREKHSDSPSFRVKCHVCGSMGPISQTIEGAERKWDGYLKEVDPTDKGAWQYALQEDIGKIIPGKSELKKDWEKLNRKGFNMFVTLLNDGMTNYSPKVNQKDLTVKVTESWTDEGDEGDFECEIEVTFDFKQGIIKQEGYCECSDIEVPGPGYMVPWDYSHTQEEVFDPKKYITEEDFDRLYTDFVENYASMFSYFAQNVAADAASIDYCEGCGFPEDECECELDENVGAPMATLGNVPGVGNAVTASTAAMTGSQQGSPSAIGSGDKWGNSLGPYTQDGKPKKKKKRVYKKKKKKANEGASINPHDKIGVSMAKRMKVPLYFKKKGQYVTQEDVEKMKPTSGKYTYKVASLKDYANLVKEDKEIWSLE